MAWPERQMDSWANLADTAAKLAAIGKGLSTYACRGQADSSWDLRPSLVRLLPEGIAHKYAITIERNALRTFKAQVHLHLPSSWLPPALPLPALTDWWPIMQHYSAPTRLLDWTFSFQVAIYFAVSSHWYKDGAVFLVHFEKLKRAIEEMHGELVSVADESFELDPPKSSRLYMFEPLMQTDRIVAQQGLFSVSLDVLGNHESIIDEVFRKSTFAGDASTYVKLIIPATLKREILLQLKFMNIAAHSLFPGADGLGRSIADLIRLREVS